MNRGIHDERQEPRELPRASGLPLVGSLPMLLWGQFRFLEESFARHGKLFELDLGLTRVVVVADAHAAEDVLVNRARSFDKGEDFWDGLRDILGAGLATSDGELWRHQRVLMQPKFQRQLIEGYRDVVTETILQELKGLSPGEPREIAHWCDELLAALTVRILFGTDLDRSRMDELRAAMASLFDMVLAGLVIRKLPRWLPRPGARKVEQARRAVDDSVMALIAERRKAPRATNDLLGTLLEATDASGAMSDRQLRDEAVTIYLAGYETTGTALAWMLRLLADEPQTCAQLQAELDAGSEESPLLHACIREGLRLYPPAPLLPRRTLHDQSLGGFKIRAGTTVLIAPWLIHRDPELWPAPNTFDPRRFMGSEAGKRSREARKRPRLAWMPFGAGQRTCIGKALAMLELEQSLRLILQRFTPQMSLDAPAPKPRLSTTLKSSRGIYLVMQPRSGELLENDMPRKTGTINR